MVGVHLDGVLEVLGRLVEAIEAEKGPAGLDPGLGHVGVALRGEEEAVQCLGVVEAVEHLHAAGEHVFALGVHVVGPVAPLGR